MVNIFYLYMCCVMGVFLENEEFSFLYLKKATLARARFISSSLNEGR